MPRPRRPTLGLTALRVAGLVLALCGVAGMAQAQPARPPAPAAPPRPASDQGPAWSSLTPGQRAALAPLERDWAGIDAQRKGKWLEIADHYQTMPPQDQARLQARMSEWVKMTPQQRNRARLQYQEARQAPPQDRQASWEAYKALPEDQRRALANRAAPTPAAGVAASSPSRSAKAAARAQPRPDGAVGDALPARVNGAPVPITAAPAKPVAPAVVQAKPGATTTLISKTPAPPPHQPSGSPKIAATPEFVDRKTLLPQAGAQSEAVARPGAPAGSANRR